MDQTDQRANPKPGRFRTRKSEILTLVIGLPTLFVAWRIDKHIDQIVEARTAPIERAIDANHNDCIQRINTAITTERERAQEKEKTLEADARELRTQVLYLSGRRR